MNRDFPLDSFSTQKPFVVSLSNYKQPFDKLRSNDFLANGKSRMNAIVR